MGTTYLECQNMLISTDTDLTQRETVREIARIIYRNLGYVLPMENILYLWESKHPTEKAVLKSALDIFEMMTGDYPDYEDEEHI
jgi:hypothetical protein